MVFFLAACEFFFFEGCIVECLNVWPFLLVVPVRSPLTQGSSFQIVSSQCSDLDIIIHLITDV